MNSEVPHTDIWYTNDLRTIAKDLDRYISIMPHVKELQIKDLHYDKAYSATERKNLKLPIYYRGRIIKPRSLY